MKTKILKVVSILLLVVIMMNLLAPEISIATNVVKEKKTVDDDIEFEPTINGKENVRLETNSNQFLEIKVKNNKQGYLKDIVISCEDCNFEFVTSDIEELNKPLDEENIISENEQNSTNKKSTPLKSVTDNAIELNEILENEISEIKIPIKFKVKKELIKSDFNRDSKITMTATNVDDRGKEKEIKLEDSIHITWENKSSGYIKQELTRNIKYSEDKTILGFKVEEGLNENNNPVVNKQIALGIPKINNQEPIDIKIIGAKNINFERKDGKIVLLKTINDEEISWNSKDSFEIIYRYNTQTQEREVITTAESKDTLVTGTVIDAIDENSTFDISNTLGYIVDVQALVPQKINKGYMYTNINRKEDKIETSYKTNYKVNVGYSEEVDKIEIIELKNEFLNNLDEVVKDGDSNIYNKKIEVNKEELINILGEEGKVIIKDLQNNELGIINKETQSLELNTEKVIIETTKPQNEGILTIEIEKAINTNVDYSKEDLQSFYALRSKTNVTEFNSSNSETQLNVESVILLENPSSQSQITINKENLSTIVENEDVILDVLLKNNDISTALYENANIEITLPEQVTNINIKSVNKLYDDELEMKNISVENNIIRFDLEGIQTKYNNSSSENGTLIKMTMNLNLDNYATSNTEKIRMQTINHNLEDTTNAEAPIEILAPTGLILTNQIEVDDKKITAFQNPVNDILIDNQADEKEMIVSGMIINNLGSDTNNLNVIGKIPFENYQSNINTTFNSEIEVEGIDDVTVSYSENGDESIEGSSWESVITTNSKSFKISSNSIFKDKSIIKFNYKVKIPSNLGYERSGKTTFGVYYNNDSIEGVNTNYAEAIPLGIATGKEPEIRLDISAIDTNEGYEIENNGDVKEGEYITLKAKLTNIGTTDANDVKFKVLLPNGISFVKYRPSTDSYPLSRYVQDLSTNEYEENIGTIKAGEEREIKIPIKITQIISSIKSNDDVNKLSIIMGVKADILPNEVQNNFTINNTEGTLNLKLSSNIENEMMNGRLFNYSIQIENANLKEKENVVIKVKLPKGIEFVEMNDKYETNYNKETNELTIYYETAKAIPNIISFKAKILDEIEGELSTVATATYIGSTKEVKSNEVLFKTEIVSDLVQAKQTTNISNNVLDTDNLEYYIEIINNSNEAKELQFIDILPSAIVDSSFSLEIEGQTIEESSSKYIVLPFELQAKQVAKAKIKVNLKGQNIGEKYTIENSPIILMDGIGIKVNSVSLEINGTSTKQIIVTTNKEDVIKENEKTEDNNNKEEAITEETYNIAGTAWLDENKNGKIDINEAKISNQHMILFDSILNDLAKDEQGNVIELTTNENGDYTFNKIKPGKYNILSEFDNKLLEPTYYKAEGLGEEENSNFTLAEYNGQNILATDTLDINNSSIYNINLGIINKDIFDLKLEQEISKITITDSENDVKVYNYESGKEKSIIEINPNELTNAKALIEYTIKITNEGNQTGYAKTIVDYLPDGMEFSSDINRDWYLKRDGNVYNSTLINTPIEPGETKELKLVAIKQLNENALGNIRNTAEIYNAYNQKGIKPIDAKAGNRVDGEKDMSSTDAIIIKPSKVKRLLVVAFSILIILLMIIGVLYIKKKWIDKMYQVDKIEGIDE